jgi:predicted phage terminase large subunit-like protein
MSSDKRREAAARAIGLAREHLAAFVTLVWRRFKVARHHRLLIQKLEAVERGEIDRLMLFMPPRHGKSLLSSVLFPCWYLGRHPDRSIIASSYGAELALDFGRRVRNHMTDALYQRIFPRAVVSGDSSAAHRFNLVAGGAYYAVGAGGVLTGRGADLLLIDDPVKNREDADSAAFRKSLREWYESVAYSRLEPGGAIVLIQTRWHQDDLAGWLLKEHASEGWEVVSLPAIAEGGDVLGRAEGEPLWPERFGREALARIREAIGGAAWAALYQQRPTAAEGAIFKREWWRFYNESTLPGRFERVLLSLDTAFKASQTADYSAAVVLGVAKTAYHVLDVWRGRVEFPELRRQVEVLASKWNPERVLVEDKASGQSLVQALQAETRLAVTAIKVDADKVSRANAVTPLVEAGKVYLLERAAWLGDFLEEVSNFPAGAHDDMVDAFTQALNFARGAGEPGLLTYYREINEKLERGENPWAELQDADHNELIQAYSEAAAEYQDGVGPLAGGVGEGVVVRALDDFVWRRWR